MLILPVILIFAIVPLFSSILRIIIVVNNRENFMTNVEFKGSVFNSRGLIMPEISEVDKLKAVTQIRLLAGGLLDDQGNSFYQTDNFLSRYLKASDFNIPAATRMALEAREWRLKNRIDDSILNETIITFPIHPFQFEGFNKEGYPLVLVNIKLIDARKLILTKKHEDLILAWIQILETGFNVLKNIRHKNLVNGKVLHGLVGIVDAAGANFKQHMCFQCISTYIEGAQILEKYYPGIVHQIIAVNVNKVGLTFLKFITPLLSSHMLNSIKLFGTNQTEWREYLLSSISPDQLSRHFGGFRISSIN